jgi:hypothetical protein
VKFNYLIWSALALLALVSYVLWWNSPTREIRRTYAALMQQKTSHSHTVRSFQGSPPQTYDIDFFCPSFEHYKNQYTDWSGSPAVRENIRYNGTYYNFVNGRWTKTGERAEINECRHGPLVDGDGIAFPFEMLGRGTKIERGAFQTVGGDSCRDYKIIIPTPYDMLHKDYRFAMCINEIDHLPRQTRRDASIAGQDESNEYSKWGDISEPPLPYGIPQ